MSTGLRRADGGRASTERLEPRTCKDEEALRKRGPGRPTDTDGLGDGAEMEHCTHSTRVRMSHMELHGGRPAVATTCYAFNDQRCSSRKQRGSQEKFLDRLFVRRGPPRAPRSGQRTGRRAAADVTAATVA